MPTLRHALTGHRYTRSIAKLQSKPPANPQHGEESGVLGVRICAALLLAWAGCSCSSSSAANSKQASAVRSPGPSSRAIAGTYRLVPRGAPHFTPLPAGALRGPHDDLLIRADGTFKWGTWSGSVSGSSASLTLLVQHPSRPTWRSFYGDRLPVGIAIDGDRLQVWLPDLGVDRDIDRGLAVGTGQDADAPDMLFRRVYS
jgi:hypothetical protein